VTYKVVGTAEAQEGLRDVYCALRDVSPAFAKRWAKGIRQSLRGLSRFPTRCPVAPESREFDGVIRELLYGSGNRGTYRILFTIIGNTVFALHVRHGSMRGLLPED
jgi:plasmid stabilization system protein ParE